MKKFLLIMIAMLFCVCVYSAENDEVTVNLNMDDNKFFHCGFTYDSSLASVEDTPNDQTAVTLTLAKDGIKAINNQEDSTNAGKLYLWWKNNGNGRAKIQLTCASALTSTDPSAAEDIKYITWKASSGSGFAESTDDDTPGTAAIVKSFTSPALDFDVQAVNIETVSIPAGATGSYSATLKVGVIDLS